MSLKNINFIKENERSQPSKCQTKKKRLLLSIDAIKKALFTTKVLALPTPVQHLPVGLPIHLRQSKAQSGFVSIYINIGVRIEFIYSAEFVATAVC